MEAERWKTGLFPNWSFTKSRRTEWRSIRDGKTLTIQVEKAEERSKNKERRNLESYPRRRQKG